jgi:hypothetical protein
VNSSYFTGIILIFVDQKITPAIGKYVEGKPKSMAAIKFQSPALMGVAKQKGDEETV